MESCRRRTARRAEAPPPGSLGGALKDAADTGNRRSRRPCSGSFLLGFGLLGRFGTNQASRPGGDAPGLAESPQPLDSPFRRRDQAPRRNAACGGGQRPRRLSRGRSARQRPGARSAISIPRRSALAACSPPPCLPTSWRSSRRPWLAVDGHPTARPGPAGPRRASRPLPNPRGVVLGTRSLKQMRAAATRTRLSCMENLVGLETPAPSAGRRAAEATLRAAHLGLGPHGRG